MDAIFIVSTQFCFNRFGMFGYTFEYQFKQEDGSTGNGEFCCVENSNCYVYMWITYLDSRTDEVDAQMWNIYNSIDVSL